MRKATRKPRWWLKSSWKSKDSIINYLVCSSEFQWVKYLKEIDNQTCKLCFPQSLASVSLRLFRGDFNRPWWRPRFFSCSILGCIFIFSHSILGWSISSCSKHPQSPLKMKNMKQPLIVPLNPSRNEMGRYSTQCNQCLLLSVQVSSYLSATQCIGFIFLFFILLWKTYMPKNIQIYLHYGIVTFGQ